MKELKKKLIKDWGKKCQAYSPLCATCLIWRAYEDIEGLYSEKFHLTMWTKLEKNWNKSHK